MDIDDMDKSDEANGDGEGVWSADIEQCFREALLLFPPCGRRKHILQEEGGGKMYGRNELIARHIMMRTGKSRTRKQVSSHIQVLARRKAKSEATNSSSLSSAGETPSSGPRISSSSNSNSQHLSTSHSQRNQPQVQSTAFRDIWLDRPIATQKIRLVHFSAFIERRNFQNPSTVAAANVMQQISMSTPNNIIQQQQQQSNLVQDGSANNQFPLTSNHQVPAQYNQASYQAASSPNYGGQHSMGPGSHSNNPKSITPVGFNRHSYVRMDFSQQQSNHNNPIKLEPIDLSQLQDRFPEIGASEGLYQRGPSDAFFLVKFWADINNDQDFNIDDQNSYFGFCSHFETVESYPALTCSTKVCSYGQQVVEKVEKIYGTFNSANGRHSYNIARSPMCDFMIKFIKKIRHLPRVSQMNSVLENFTVLQVVSNDFTSEILLCLAYVFEVGSTLDQNKNDSGAKFQVFKLTKD